MNGLPDVLHRAWEKIGDPTINHMLIIRYSSGTDHHIPWHSDKTRTMVQDSSIYNLVVCDRPRVFQLAEPEHIKNRTDGHGEASVYRFNQPMAPCSAYPGRAPPPGAERKDMERRTVLYRFSSH
jgi:hypothetical protein